MSNIQSYFGRGLSFNGVDQSVSTNTFEITGESSILFMIIPSAVVGQLPVIGNRRVMLHNGRIQMDFRDAGGSADVYVSSEGSISIGETYCVVVTFYNDSVEVHINGVLNARTETPTVGLRYSDIASNGGAYFNGVISNVIVVNQALTPEQIKYQYEHPERFLYREDEVLKSQILSQAEIDDVVSYMPLCETDGYVRDLVSYSEVDTLQYVRFIEDGDNYEDLLVGTTVTSGSINNAQFWLISPDVFVGLENCIVEFEVSNVSGTPSIGSFHEGNNYGGRIYIDSIPITNGVISTPVIHGRDSEDRVQFYINADASWSFDITNIKLLELTGTYPIANYTDAIRTDAIQLPTGLQTSKWKRDELGVPYAFSDAIECDGVGYIDTNWIPSANEDFTIEVVMQCVAEGTHRIHGQYSNPTTGLVYFGSNDNGDVYARIGVSTNYLEGSRGQINHFTMAYTASTKEAAFILNGAYSETRDTGFTGATDTMWLGQPNKSGYVATSPLKLFKVHDRALTAQEVKYRYDKAVTAGLLAPDGALQDANGNYILDENGDYIIVEME